MIVQLATIVTNEDLLAGFAMTSLLCVPLMALIWMVRVMMSLRKRLDSIEDKLDFLLKLKAKTEAANTERSI